MKILAVDYGDSRTGLATCDRTEFLTSPVRMWDERQTTCAAADLLDESGTFGARRKSILDSVSATVILDDYIQWRKEHPGEV